MTAYFWSYQEFRPSIVWSIIPSHSRYRIQITFLGSVKDWCFKETSWALGESHNINTCYTCRRLIKQVAANLMPSAYHHHHHHQRLKTRYERAVLGQQGQGPTARWLPYGSTHKVVDNHLESNHLQFVDNQVRNHQNLLHTWWNWVLYKTLFHHPVDLNHHPVDIYKVHYLSTDSRDVKLFWSQVFVARSVLFHGEK